MAFAGISEIVTFLLFVLGTSLSVILHIEVSVAIISSAAVAILYTMFGHMMAVAYTDILQLLLIVVGLVLSIPFIMSHPAVESIAITSETWRGNLDMKFSGLWTDLLIAMVSLIQKF